MELYQVGKLIKEYRRRKGISQEALSFGICSTVTLSRIETEKELPSKRIIELLFERLGYTAPLNNAAITESEIIRYNIESLLEQKINKRDFEFAELLEQYTNDGSKMNKFEVQIFLLYSAIFALHHNANKTLLAKKLNYALKLTHSDYQDVLNNKEKDFHFSKSELLIFFYIALIQSSIPMLEYIAKYIDKNIMDSIAKAKYHTMILTNLCRLYTENKKYLEAIETSLYGATKCAEYGKILYLPPLVMYRGIATYFSKNKNEGLKIINDSFKMFSYFGTEIEQRSIVKLYGIEL